MIALVALALAGDAPEISTSRGPEDGLVILWPRVVPATDNPEVTALAGRVQAYLAEVAGRTGRPLDVRPDPERVCPKHRGGCEAPTISAFIGHADGGCVVVGLIGGVGESGQDLLPWVGQVQVRSRHIDFRVRPEDSLRVTDFVPCSAAADALSEREDLVADALREAIVAAP